MGKAHRIKSANDNRPQRAAWLLARPKQGLQRLGNAQTAIRYQPSSISYSPAPQIQPRSITKQESSRPKSNFMWRIKQVLLLLAMLAFLAAAHIFAASQDAVLSMFQTFVLICAIGLSVYLLTRTLMPLMFSLYGSACWAGLTLVPLIQGLPAPAQEWQPVIPLIIIAQLWAASNLKSRRSLIIASISAAVWCALLAFQAAMPAAALGSLIFILGAAQHRLGKAAKDRAQFGADLHSLTGWLIAVMGAAIVQYHWLDYTAHANLTGQSLPSFWLWSVGLCAAVILISSLMRYHTRHISAVGIFIVSTVTLILPLSVSRPDLIIASFDAVPGLAAVPSFGLVIGAAIIASSIGMIVNGLRRTKFSFVIFGALVFGMQTLLILQPVMTGLDFAVVTLMSLVMALAIGGLVAGHKLSEA